MIETSNTEINVEELMQRVRAEAAKLRTADLGIITRRDVGIDLPAVRVLPPPPRTPAIREVELKKERLESLLHEAREKGAGNPRIPKMLRRFFRKQGSYNRLLRDAVGLVWRTQTQVGKQLRELAVSFEIQGRWLRSLSEHRQSDGTWMRAAAREIANLSAYSSEREGKSVAEEVLTLRSQVDELRQQLKDLATEVERQRNPSR